MGNVVPSCKAEVMQMEVSSCCTQFLSVDSKRTELQLQEAGSVILLLDKIMSTMSGQLFSRLIRESIFFL